jgi:glucokinase
MATKMKENGTEVNMLLAGDIGGTKTLLGLYEAAGRHGRRRRHHPAGPQARRPHQVAVRSFSTRDYPDLATIITTFTGEESVRRAPLDSAAFGVAGPVIDGVAQLTNVGWRVEATGVASALGIRRVGLLNDLEAMAYGVPALEESELHTLQAGDAIPGGNMAVIAAGTGLGEAFLHNVDGRFVASPSEGGHADFAARTERDIVLLRDLIHRFGRAEVEHVLSGHGLVNIHHVTHTGGCPAVTDESDPRGPGAISLAALERRCAGCVEALSMFVAAYGAEAGNLALRTVSTAGLFVGGGIAPKILPALSDGAFMRAFRDKAPFEDMMEKIPVKVIVNPEAGLLGAAVYAANL